jgi:hypothetical protein
MIVLQRAITFFRNADGGVGGHLEGVTKDGKKIIHSDPNNLGGIYEGKKHTQGGIKGINTSTGQPIEVESEEAQMVPKAATSNTTYEFEGQKLTAKEVMSKINQSGGGVALAKKGMMVQDKRTGKPLEYNGNNIIITAPAVKDGTKREFEGKEMTNREILSKINQDHGGIAFEDGGEIDGATCACSGRMYKYGGKEKSDADILSDIANTDNDAEEAAEDSSVAGMAQGGALSQSPAAIQDFWENRQAEYAALGTEIIPYTGDDDYKGTWIADGYKEGGSVGELTDFEKKVLKTFEITKKDILKFNKSSLEKIDNLINLGIVTVSKDFFNSNYTELILTDHGKDNIGKYAAGGRIDVNMMKHGDVIDKKKQQSTSYFKGIKHNYKNAYELNKAIEELLDSKEDDLDFDSEEKVFLRYYSGYGGLDKFGATGKGILYEYYTPSAVVEKMWGLAYKYGYKGGKVLEPACGTGEFIKYAPHQKKVTGYEINKYSARICKILYPDANIFLKPFEELFIKNRDTIKGKTLTLDKYSLVIGNPPYGNFEGLYAGMGEKAYTRAQNYIDYFIFRGLDLLESGGLLVFIVGAEPSTGGRLFLEQQMNSCKKEIAEKADLLDGYRLPNGIFERTDVTSDIIVLQKK